ncbi:DUF2514 family protein [Pseudomonas oryziphila]|nr:DUF2514 family protein [Pseudomonas oryziphila]
MSTAVFAQGWAACRVTMVLSDLIARYIDTNPELAEALDQARIVGPQCGGEYAPLSSWLDSKS